MGFGGKPGQEAVEEGVPDLLVDAVANAVEFLQVGRDGWVAADLRCKGSLISTPAATEVLAAMAERLAGLKTIPAR